MSVEEEHQVKKRKYEEIDVDVPHPVEQVTVVDASQRMSKWPRMKTVMLKALGVEFEEVVPEPTVTKGEAVYVIAKAQHPFGDEVVCLVEKSRGQGYVLMPEKALAKIRGRAMVTAVGQQYSNWASMEEKMGIKVTPEFKARIGQVGLVLAKEPHPRDTEIQVVALQIAEGGVVLVKSRAIRELPVSIVEVTDPLARYTPWAKMAEALGIEEPKDPPTLAAGQAGIAVVSTRNTEYPTQAEKKHFNEPDTIVVAVELLSGMLRRHLTTTGAGKVMLDKRGLKYVKY